MLNMTNAVNLSANLSSRKDQRDKYTQFFSFGKDYFDASKLLYRERGDKTYIQLDLLCHALENVLKYAICELGGFYYEFEKGSKESKSRHDLEKLFNKFCTLTKSAFPKAQAKLIRVEVQAFNNLYKHRDTGYGGKLKTIFHPPNSFKTEQIESFLENVFVSRIKD